MKSLLVGNGSCRRAAAVALTALLAGDIAIAASLARGSIAGKIFDKRTQELLSDVTIGVRALTSGEVFEVKTDGNGVYFVEDAPDGVYAFTLSADGIDYPLPERFDVRVGMPFLLESCFEIDRQTLTAGLRAECDSGFVELARVANIGPHRFMVEQRNQEQDDDAEPPPAVPDSNDVPLVPETIDHDELECLVRDRYPIVDASISPGEAVQTSRVYFRSDKYPDFYYVEMPSENPTIDDFRAVLPKPSAETERIYYYLEAVDSNFDGLQTEEFDPEVLDVDDCDDPAAAYLGEDPGIVIGATTAGAAAIPPGFQAVGITGFLSSVGVLTTVGGAAAATGGIASTTGIVLVVAGTTAAAAGTTVAVTGDKEASDVK